jgi:guanine deaminase
MPDFFEIACREAEQGMSAGDGGPFGALVVKDGIIAGQGHNSVLSSRDSTAHAEITAIRDAERTLGNYDLSGCEIYTTCYPCPMCLGAIMWARITKVHYGCSATEAATIGFDDQAMYNAFLTPQSNSFVTMKGYDIPGPRQLFQKWLDLDNRKMY